MSEEFKRAFESKEEFMKFYEEHKTEIDKLNTKQLNSVYKIKDCKISKNKKKLVVKPDTTHLNKESNIDLNMSYYEEPDKTFKPVEKPKSIKQTHMLAKSKQTKPKAKQIKPQDLEKMINHIITEYEKQLSNLKELKNKLVSDDLFESDISNEILN